MKPYISVITVTYNATNLLPGLIESLRRQTDRNFEWIIVDGASCDGTVDLLTKSGDVITHWISEPDFGIYHAINKALQLASGEYYLVLGADDRLNPDAITLFKHHAYQSKADIITAWVLREGRIDKGKLHSPWLYAMHAYVINHSVSALIRRSLHDQYGLYSKRFTVMADMYFIKKACSDKSIKVFVAPFLAGEYGKSGVSSVDKAAAFCDYFRVQFETEKHKLLQIILFSVKLIWRAKDLILLSRKYSAK
jgi:glycosyltransferase involved in cell wall biosynthesis